ncbi:MAG: rod shape-determining protein MreD [Alphaproteobacteria bacterium]
MGYFSTGSERAEAGIRFIVPYSLMAVLLVFSIVSFTFPVAGSVKAPLLLMAIYYWAIYRPTLIPAWLVFTAGILVDFIIYYPVVGISALVFVVVHWIVSDQRRYLMGQSFLMTWIGFVIVSTVAGLAQWFIFGFLNGMWPPLRPLCFSVLLGVALFPVISMLLHITHKILPEPRTGYMMKAKSR